MYVTNNSCLLSTVMMFPVTQILESLLGIKTRLCLGVSFFFLPFCEDKGLNCFIFFCVQSAIHSGKSPITTCWR